MDYQFENLTPERFQQFCQALLSTVFPGVQSFPVGQPDGGRDAVWKAPSDDKGFTVFQVKFVRDSSSTDLHKWLTDTLDQEGPKLSTLVPLGASHYYLITNVRGTGHLKAGSIDKVDKILADKITVPATCWWRDDLSRYLDAAHDLRWTFPELLSGTDVLRYFAENSGNEDARRRSLVVRAFVKQQFDLDREVKFKQVELQSDLLQLFVDLPIAVKREVVQRSTSKTRNLGYDSQYIRYLYARSGRRVAAGLPDAEVDARERPLAAETLLSQTFQQKVPMVVLEGAPGQGKSTITQFVCQVHRMKLLGYDDLSERLPSTLTATPVRVPFKVDLRDLALWVKGVNPFTQVARSEGDSTSLESFLVSLVQQNSGNHDFTATDLQTVLSESPVLLVFDGLDEVAEIGQRGLVVETVTSGVNRLSVNAKSLQVIVTSRPAAFSNSPGFSGDDFAYLDLSSLTRELVDKYAERWMEVRRLSGREIADMRRTLRSRLDQPHLAELSKNPMQLAILLSLIHTRGASLPDKRTQLYRAYVELFFSREAEKSFVVRDNRDLLVDLHGYLAWILHAEAELGENGRLSGERLRVEVGEYLRLNCFDRDFEELFRGMVERVVAIVSRVEGTYEFEVQPLREYFAAYFLYETAPYSPTGDEQPGTKPDRFDALAKNNYWLNVTRFYAGFYSKGELASLVDRLQALIDSPIYGLTTYPRTLAAMLISDWVFSQDPRLMKRVVGTVLDGLGLRALNGFRAGRRGRREQVISLPERCGRKELFERSLELLKDFPPPDFARALHTIAVVNAGEEERLEAWQAALSDMAEGNLGSWLREGLFLEVMHLVSPSEIEKILANRHGDRGVYETLFYARRFDVVEKDKKRIDTMVSVVLNETLAAPYRPKVGSPIEALAVSLDPTRYTLAFHSRERSPLRDVLKSEGIASVGEIAVTADSTHSTITKCQQIARAADEALDYSASAWSTTLEPWEILVEASRSQFGDTWATYRLANVAAGIKSTSERGATNVRLHDESVSLCRRARYARLRSGSNSIGWWKEQFRDASTEDQIAFSFLLLFCWARSETLVGLIGAIDEDLVRLPTSSWKTLADAVQTTLLTLSGERRMLYTSFDSKKLPVSLSSRMACLLVYRAKQSVSLELYDRYLDNYMGSDPIILATVQGLILQKMWESRSVKAEQLSIIRKAYALGLEDDPYAFLRLSRRIKNPMELDLAQEITSNPTQYPDHILGLAEDACRLKVERELLPVLKIAQRDGWFFR